MKITKLALGTLTALCLCLPVACDDAKKDVKDGKTEAKAADAKAADAKATDVKAAEAKADEAKAPEAKADEAKAPEAKADAGATAAAPTVTIGVAECDDYVGKMNACIAAGTVPAAEVEAQKMGLEMSSKSWADAMKANPDGGSGLVAGCKAAIDMGRLKYPTCFP